MHCNASHETGVIHSSMASEGKLPMMQQLTLRVPADLKEWLEKKATEQKRTVSDIVRLYLERIMEEEA